MQFGRNTDARTAWTSIVGFACNQGFVFSLFYLGSNRGLGDGVHVFERAELFGTLLFMTAAFVLLRLVASRARDALLARPLVWCYAALLVVGSFVPLLVENPAVGGLVLECALLGLPAGCLLAAWGRALGREPIARSVPEVFLGSALGAAACFACAVVPVAGAVLVLKLLPLGSAAALRRLLAGPPVSVLAPAEGAATLPSGKIVAGTAVFGLAAGFIETYGSDPGMATTPTFPVTLFLFVLFCIAALQLFGGGGGTPAEDIAPAEGQGPLDGSYRLAVLLMMAGFLFVPVLADFGVPGEAIVLAGYLGLSAVLVSLFLVMGRITGQDAALSFARGFTALFAGEMAGIALGNLLDLVGTRGQTPYAVVACAGLAALFAYLVPVHRARLPFAFGGGARHRPVRGGVPPGGRRGRPFRAARQRYCRWP